MDDMKHLDQILNQVHSHLKEDLNPQSALSRDGTFALHHDRYAQMVALETSRHHTLNSLSAVPRSPRVRRAVQALLHEAELHVQFCERVDSLEKSPLKACEKQQLLHQLESQKKAELESAVISPHLSLEEHTAVLCALMQEAVESHVENTLANLQVDLHIQKAS